MNDITFQYARDTTFRSIIQNRDLFNKSMSLYCDNQLRTCFLDLNDSEIFVRLEKIMSLISIINDHASFIESYVMHLSDRLKTSTYFLKAELLMIESLKLHFPQNSLDKIELMLPEANLCQNLQY